MNTVLDSLFLRRPLIDYVSPPICEAIFSSTGFPTIFIEPFEKLVTPSGPVWSPGGFRFFTWPRTPGEICHNVYIAADPNNPNSPYNIIAECIPPGMIAVCSSGSFTVTATLTDGTETSQSTPVISHGTGYVFIPQPQFPLQVCVNLYKNGHKLWSCFSGDAFEVCGCGRACYRVSSITLDGETQLSAPICYTGDPSENVCPSGFTWDAVNCTCFEECTVLPCPPGQSWLPAPDCHCAPCQQQTCPPGQTWNPSTCSCQSGPCTPFVDNFFGLPEDIKTGGVTCGEDFTASRPFIYRNRVYSTFTTGDANADSHPLFVDEAGDVFGVGMTDGIGNFVDRSWVKLFGGAVVTITPNGEFPVSGPNSQNEIVGVSNLGLTAYSKTTDSGAHFFVDVWNVGSQSVIYTTPVIAGISTTVPDQPVGLAGHVLISKDLGTTFSRDVWSQGGGLISTGMQSQNEYGVHFNTSGHMAISLDLPLATQAPDVWYWNGTTATLVVPHSGSTGYKVHALNTTNLATGLDTTGLPWRWDPIGGFVALPLPAGATFAFRVFCDDNGNIYGGFDNGCFVYRSGAWHNLLTMFQAISPLWSVLTFIVGVSPDGFLTGYGTYNGSFAGFVANLCL